MLKQMDKNAVIKLKREGYSNRSVATMLRINRKTVGRYWNEYLSNMHAIDNERLCNSLVSLLQEKALGAPQYDTSRRRNKKYTTAIDELIDGILEAEKEKDVVLGTHKQKLTNAQIYALVKAAGHEIGLSTVSAHIQKKRAKLKECFIRQEYEYGQRLEYDFGEVKLIIGGVLGTYHMAVFSSPASNFRYAYLYKNQKQEVFMDSHVRFFKMVDGVYREIVYDNMRNVVAKFIGRTEKELNQNLIMLSNYYDFHINVTNCFKGNEKGHVEGSVKIIRQEAFALKWKFESYEAACEYLEVRLSEMNKESRIGEEKEVLKPARPPYELSKITEQKVNSYSFVQVDKNRYSVPDYLVGKTVTVRNHVDAIRIYSSGAFVCEHNKKDGAGEVSIDIRHYLTSLARKPGALKNSLALKSIPTLKTIFDIHFTSRPRDFIALLVENKEKSMEEIIDIFRRQGELGMGQPLNSVPDKEQLSLKTKKLLSSYTQLCIGGAGL